MIDQRHSIPLTTAVQASTPQKGALAEALYHEAEALLFNRPIKSSNVSKYRLVAVQKLENKEHRPVQARVVDNETGFFVELSAIIDEETGAAVTGPYLVYGKMYVIESKNPQLSNTQTKIWR